MTMKHFAHRSLMAATALLCLIACTKEPGDTPTKPTPTDTITPTIPVEDYGPAHDTVFEANGIRFHMRYVPAGRFYMGATNTPGAANYDADADPSVEAPVHRVTMRHYLMAETEVTNALYFAVMHNNPSPDRDIDLPVRGVSFTTALTFAQRLSEVVGIRFRLPTEAEWEYAARGAGADSAAHFTFSGSNVVDEVAWYADNSDNQPHYPAQKAPNTLGLYDMTGNLAEWCTDWYGTYLQQEQENPQGPDQPLIGSQQRRVVRGGSFNQTAYFLRNTWRDSRFGSYEGYDVGIRLVVDCQ